MAEAGKIKGFAAGIVFDRNDVRCLLGGVLERDDALAIKVAWKLMRSV